MKINDCSQCKGVPLLISNKERIRSKLGFKVVCWDCQRGHELQFSTDRDDAVTLWNRFNEGTI